MNRARISLIGIVLCAAFAATAVAVTSGVAQPQPAGVSFAVEPTIPGGQAIVPEPVPMSSFITCTFNCNDGIGLNYQCTYPTLGQCCAQAQPACSSHDGLASGICWQGHLGLPCTPE